jgi:hypothetical protein
VKIKSIKKVPNEAVYNLTINKYHNYLTSSGLVLKNCDALRYFCVNFTNDSKEPLSAREKEYREEKRKARNSYINFGV